MKEGFDVRTCEDGFSALVKLRFALPDLIICDLRMPSMSGFELLSIVRRRFPQIPVIAISGEFDAAGPFGLLADAFFQKGAYRPDQLFIKIASLLKSSPLRPSSAKSASAPVWTPLNDRGYYVLTCSECLRSFSVPQSDSTEDLCETECINCGAMNRYLRQSGSERRLTVPKV
jgi:CheY-like chemotaxis protein